MSARRLSPVLVLLVPCAGAWAQEVARPPLNPLAALGKSNFKAFVEQPLFDPARRLPTVAAPVIYEPPPPPPAPPEPPPALHLLGVIQGPQAVAIVRRDDTGKTETLRSGDRIGSWDTEVLAVGLRVKNNGRVFDYLMFRSGAQSGPVAEAAPSDPVTATVAARNARLMKREY